ncbi:hypothetical protein HI914_00570, partial [Erysiphe necator]
IQNETTTGFTTSTVSRLIFHPLDVCRSTTSTPVTTYTVVRGLVSSGKPLQRLYRGLMPNLVGNSGSWSFFLGFKSVIEGQIIKYRIFMTRDLAALNNTCKASK